MRPSCWSEGLPSLPQPRSNSSTQSWGACRGLQSCPAQLQESSAVGTGRLFRCQCFPFSLILQAPLSLSEECQSSSWIHEDGIDVAVGESLISRPECRQAVPLHFCLPWQQAGVAFQSRAALHLVAFTLPLILSSFMTHGSVNKPRKLGTRGAVRRSHLAQAFLRNGLQSPNSPASHSMNKIPGWF